MDLGRSVSNQIEGDMTLVGAFITENARMAHERCAAVCAALVPNVAALAALPGFEQQVPVCTVPQHTRQCVIVLMQSICEGAYGAACLTLTCSCPQPR